VSSHGVLGRLSGLGMRYGSVRMVLLGGMRRSRFGRVRRMPRDVGMRDLGARQPGRQRKRSRKRQQSPHHVIIFGTK
jgi:hypothetical protein